MLIHLKIKTSIEFKIRNTFLSKFPTYLHKYFTKLHLNQLSINVFLLLSFLINFKNLPANSAHLKCFNT